MYILIFIFLKSKLEDKIFCTEWYNKDSLTSISEKLAPTYQTKRNNNQKLAIPVNLKTFTEDLQYKSGDGCNIQWF